jgi:glycine betaine/choline ABC-type transport system substrate-binding protein
MPFLRQEVSVKKLFALLSMLLVMSVAQHAAACVGKTLYVGITGTPHELLFAEIISQLVSERTGTTVKILQYKDSTELYNAVKKGEVGVLVENTERALRILDRKETNPRLAYDLAKKEYRKSLNLVWLESFGTGQAYAPVISVDTMGHLPALPKLLNKLSGVLNEDSCSRLLKSLKSDEKPRRIARDFLKAKKLI